MDDIRFFRIEFAERQKNLKQAIKNVKYSADYSSLCNILDAFDKTDRFKMLFYGNAQPSTIKELCTNSILVNSNTGDSFKEELNWLLLSVRKYKDEILSFTAYKEEYDIALVTGKYTEAELCLDKIDEQLGVSMWSVENRLLLNELQRGIKQNTSYLNEINQKTEIGFLRQFFYYLSIKAEKELSVARYENTLFKLLSDYSSNGHEIDSIYYYFKTNILSTTTHDLVISSTYYNLAYFLAFEGYMSVLDRFLSLINILAFSSINPPKELHEFLGSRISYVQKKISCKEIYRLQYLYFKTPELIHLSNNDRRYIKLQDLLYSGNYKQLVTDTLIYIRENPLSIEGYELLAKTSILQGIEIDIGTDKTIINQIYICFYNILSRNEKSLESAIILKQIAYNISSVNSISFYLLDFMSRELGIENISVQFTYIHSNQLNEALLTEIINSHFTPSQIQQSPYLYCISSTFKKNKSNLNETFITSQFLNYHIALQFQKEAAYLKALRTWNILEKETQKIEFLLEPALANSFHCLMQLGKFDEIIEKYVRYFFVNPNLIRRVDTISVKAIIKRDKFQLIKHSIELPVFYATSTSDDYEIHTAYECFLLKNDCLKPSEIIIKYHLFDLDFLIYFLHKICVLDILKHSPFITSTENKINERIIVCQFLQTIDETNTHIYKEEVERLTKRKIIQKGLQEIDDSKIYVNKDGLIAGELRDLKSIYNRYKAVAQLRTEKQVFFLANDNVYGFSEDKGHNDKHEFSKDPQYDLFKEMFLSIKEKFLFSRYGLKQYLSTRIRHGVLLGEIRPEFEHLKLITDKEKGGESYKQNNYWNNALSFIDEESCTNIQNTLSNFSSAIDRLINDEILLKYIHIKTENENEDGWLDYSYSDMDLQTLYVIFKLSKADANGDYEEVVNHIISSLYARTSLNLEIIQNKVRGEIKNAFFEIINKAELDLRLTIGGNVPEIFQNLTEVRVKVENKLDKIARWFTLTNSQISNFKIEKAIDVAVEALSGYLNDTNFMLDRKINNYNDIRGSFYPSLVDLIRIFLENIIKYADHEGNAIEAEIEVYNLNPDKICIELTNKIKENINIHDLRQEIGSIAIDLAMSTKEGNSGFYKALSILKLDLVDEGNDMDLTVSEDRIFKVKLTISKKSIVSDEGITS